MAVASFTPVAPAGNGSNNTIYSATLGSAAESGLITLGNDMIVRIAVTGNAAIRFGTTTNLASNAATATDILLPGAQVMVVDLGHYNNAIRIYSLVASNIITVSQVSKN